MLDGRAEELAEQCVTAAKNRVELLKNAVPSVAPEAEECRWTRLQTYMHPTFTARHQLVGCSEQFADRWIGG